MIKKTLQKTCPSCGVEFLTTPSWPKELCEKCYQKNYYHKLMADPVRAERHRATNRKYLLRKREALSAKDKIRRLQKQINGHLDKIMSYRERIKKLEEGLKNG